MSAPISIKGDQHVRTKAVVFDVGGVLIDLHSEAAARELSEKYGLLPDTFARLTRSCFESHPRSITELAMIGQVGAGNYIWDSKAAKSSGRYLLRFIKHDCSALGDVNVVAGLPLL
jgi:FMN phosphatase YigB (HAD superfamily)